MSQEIFDQITLVNVDFGIWSAYKRTTEEDLRKMNASLPGAGVITKGGKKIYPSENLSELHALKKKVTRKVSSIGVAALGGTARAVPVSSLKEIEDYLQDCRNEFEQLLSDFSSSYDTVLKNHLQAIVDPVVKEIVSNSVMTVGDACSRFRFGWDTFKIVPNGGKGKTLVDNLASKLYAEIAQGAKEAYEKSFLGKPRVGQKALHQIIALRNKLTGLSMLDGANIDAIEAMMDDVLNQLPKAGWIEGKDLSALLGLVFTMSEPERMLLHAEKIRNGLQASQAVQEAAAAAQEETAIAEESSVEAVVAEEVEAPAVAAEPVVASIFVEAPVVDVAMPIAVMTEEDEAPLVIPPVMVVPPKRPSQTAVFF